MLPFWQTMEPALVLMALFALGTLLLATVLCASYYQGGRSIYLMRRLPDGGCTLRRQVWTVPLRWMVACIAAAAVLSVLSGTSGCPPAAAVAVPRDRRMRGMS